MRGVHQKSTTKLEGEMATPAALWLLDNLAGFSVSRSMPRCC